MFPNYIVPQDLCSPSSIFPQHKQQQQQQQQQQQTNKQNRQIGKALNSHALYCAELQERQPAQIMDSQTIADGSPKVAIAHVSRTWSTRHMTKCFLPVLLYFQWGVMTSDVGQTYTGQRIVFALDGSLYDSKGCPPPLFS